MEITNSSQTRSLGRPAVVILAILGVVAIYYGASEVFPYFSWSEGAYGYYWPFRLELIFHIVGGLVALLAGVFQLWTGLRKVGMKAHPLMGRLYVAGVFLGSIGGAILSFTSAVYGLAWGVALFVLAAAWMVITGVAVHCIRCRNIRAHQEWMIRSYILTFGFVTFRLLLDYLPYTALWDISRADMAVAVIWPSWVVPLIIYQIYLQYGAK